MNEDKATRYHRLKRQASILSLVWAVALLGGLLATGWSAVLRDAAEATAGRIAPAAWRPGVTVLGYVVLLSLLNEIGSLPLGFYSGFLLERRYGMSVQRFRSYARDAAKSLAIGLAVTLLAVEAVYALLAATPDWWWLYA